MSATHDVTREREELIAELRRRSGACIGYDNEAGADCWEQWSEPKRWCDNCLLSKVVAALAAPPAEDEKMSRDSEPRYSQIQLDEATKPLHAEIERLKAQAPPASDPPGLTVINEDDGDVTIDFDYANDRVVSIRLGEESSGLSAFVDGESHALCPLDRVPPKVLALLRTSAKSVTLRQSDPPGLVALVRLADEYITLLESCQDGYYRASESDDAKRWRAAKSAYPLPASPQAKA